MTFFGCFCLPAAAVAAVVAGGGRARLRRALPQFSALENAPQLEGQTEITQHTTTTTTTINATS